MPKMKVNKRAPSEVDKRLGEVIRARRLMANMSQEELGKRLGVTFQQVQKYEKGSNRITFNRLMEIAKELNESPAYFIGEMKPLSAKATSAKGQLTNPRAVRLLEAFSKIPHSKEMVLVHVAEALMNEHEDS